MTFECTQYYQVQYDPAKGVVTVHLSGDVQHVI
jgi:hypothetical protein